LGAFSVKVVPKSTRDEIAGWLDGVLKVRVRAAPEKGRANAAVEELLARELGVPRRNVRVVAGHTAPRKTVEVDGVDGGELAARLARIAGAEPQESLQPARPPRPKR
jgi:uncharacterized protein YggU (UPF0235/DUF167 family)